MTVIKSVSEISINAKIKALIYGQPGVGKTTLAVSAPKPLILDYDGGIHRVNFGHLSDVGIVQVSSFEETNSVLSEDLSAYETIIFDTGGKCLDFMGEYIVRQNPKMGRANGMLTLQGYGERKQMFSALVKKVTTMGKHIIFVAHRETKTEGDDTRYVPLFGGSNYDSLVTELDLVGYVEAQGRNRTITFDPTSRNDGKNTCNLPANMVVPVIVDEAGNTNAPNDFFTERIIKPYIARIATRKQEASQFDIVMKGIEDYIDLITDAASANAFIDDMANIKHVGNSKMLASKKLAKKATELKLTLDKATKRYV